MRRPTDAQRRVLDALVDAHDEGRATVRKVAVRAGLASPNTAHTHLTALARLGLAHALPVLRPDPSVVRVQGELYRAEKVGLTCPNPGEHAYGDATVAGNETGPDCCANSTRPLATGPVQEDR